MDDPNAFIEADAIKDSREHRTPILYRNEKVWTKGEAFVFPKRMHCVAQHRTLEDIAS
jgi:hypothetical protein